MRFSDALPPIFVALLGACTIGDGAVSVPVASRVAIESWQASPPAASRARDRSNVRILIGGDLLPHRPMLSDPAQIASALAPLHDLFASADAVVANYETATGQVDDARNRDLVYGVEPAWMDAVAGSGVTAISLANNHACDLGRAGLEATIAAARGSIVGLGADAVDPWQPRTIAEKNGVRVCAVAWTEFTNDPKGACERSRELAIAPLGKKGTLRAVEAIRNARASGCSATIAIIHGGLEYEPQSRAVMAQAFAVAEAGADAVVIHHPHVPSPVEVVGTSDGRRVPIFASVGNLVSNQGESWTTAYPPMQIDHHIVYLNGWTRAGLVAEIDFRVRDGKPQVGWGYHVVWTDNDHLADKSNKTPHIDARVLDPTADVAVVEKLALDRTLGSLLNSPFWLEMQM